MGLSTLFLENINKYHNSDISCTVYVYSFDNVGKHVVVNLKNVVRTGEKKI